MSNSTDINYHALLYEENIYVVIHMLLIFWIPATIVLVKTKINPSKSVIILFFSYAISSSHAGYILIQNLWHSLLNMREIPHVVQLLCLRQE